MERVKRKRGYTRVSPKNQVTLPAEVLAQAGLRAGDRLRVAAGDAGQVVLSRADDPIDTFAGALKGLYPLGYLDKLRDEWR